MAELRDQFIAGCQRPGPDGPGMAHTLAATLWEQVIAFAGYGFNQGHATAYADVSYRSAYLKAHWRRLFCAPGWPIGAVSTTRRSTWQKLSAGDSRRPPHVNASGERFTLTQDAGAATLWMGWGPCAICDAAPSSRS